VVTKLLHGVSNLSSVSNKVIARILDKIPNLRYA
jgi:hypothetical protein